MNSLCKLSPFANGRSILFSNAHGVCRTRAPYTMQVYHHYTPVQWTKPDICSSPLCTETTHRSNRPSQTLVPVQYAPRLHTGRTDIYLPTVLLSVDHLPTVRLLVSSASLTDRSPSYRSSLIIINIHHRPLCSSSLNLVHVPLTTKAHSGLQFLQLELCSTKHKTIIVNWLL